MKITWDDDLPLDFRQSSDPELGSSTICLESSGGTIDAVELTDEQMAETTEIVFPSKILPLLEERGISREHFESMIMAKFNKFN